MARPPRTWLTTDTHFHHDMLVREGIRPADFQDRIVRRWKHLVKPEDTVIHLGDVIFYKHDTLKQLLDDLPGTKFLVMGNHDHKSRLWYSRNGFAAVFDGLVLGDVYLSHKPAATLPSGCTVNVHGHLHSNAVASPYPHGRLLALEYTAYSPVPFPDWLVRQNNNILRGGADAEAGIESAETGLAPVRAQAESGADDSRGDDLRGGEEA